MNPATAKIAEAYKKFRHKWAPSGSMNGDFMRDAMELVVSATQETGDSLLTILRGVKS